MEESTTLNLAPMEENFDCFEASSPSAGNKVATKEHFEAFKRS